MDKATKCIECDGFRLGYQGYVCTKYNMRLTTDSDGMPIPLDKCKGGEADATVCSLL